MKINKFHTSIILLGLSATMFISASVLTTKKILKEIRKRNLEIIRLTAKNKEFSNLEKLVGFIDGYTDKLSYEYGETAYFHLNYAQTHTPFKIKVFDVNQKLVDTVDVKSVWPQPILTTEPWKKGLGYDVTFNYKITDKLSAGLYYLDNKVPFIVKGRKSSNNDIVILYPSNTINAYAVTKDKNLYTDLNYGSTPLAAENRALVLSFQRPFIPDQTEWHSQMARGFLRWMNTNNNFGHNVRIITDSDIDDYQELKNTKLLVIIGHSEYWTRKAREHFDRFVDTGGNVAVLSGNTMWWQVRYSEDQTQMIGYKAGDKHTFSCGRIKDPHPNPLLHTENWDRPKLQYPIETSIGVRFFSGGYPSRTGEGFGGYKILAPKSPLLEKTGLNHNDILKVYVNEYDTVPIKSVTTNGIPVIDKEKLGFHKIEMIAYNRMEFSDAPITDYTQYNQKVDYLDKMSFYNFVVFQKKPDSGTVVNVAINSWASIRNMETETDKEKIKQITYNIIDKLYRDKPVFSPNLETRE